MNLKHQIEKIIEPKHHDRKQRINFSNHMLKMMIIPLLIEQVLVMMVGISDTLMISYAGEEAVSGVSLVNQLITVFLFVFTALASGGAVVVSQYIGSREKKKGNLAAGQLLIIALLMATFFTILFIFMGNIILQEIFNNIEPEVMDSSKTYLQISVYSFIPLAIYNVGTAIFRSMSKTRTTMIVSILMNIINIFGNYIGIFILHAGVAGVAWPTFISRTIAAAIMISLCFNRQNTVYLEGQAFMKFDFEMIKRILKIALPNSIEDGALQLSKVVIASILALFGTSQIAANGVAQSFWSLAAVTGRSMSPAFITIIGQSMGGKDQVSAQYYMMKLLRITFLISIVFNTIIIALTPVAMTFYNLPADTKQLIIILVLIHNFFNAFIFPISLPFANGLRAAGDVRYTMMISILATCVVRIFCSYVFAIILNLGVIGLAWAMVADWSTRSIANWIRYKNGKWLLHQVIE